MDCGSTADTVKGLGQLANSPRSNSKDIDNIAAFGIDQCHPGGDHIAIVTHM